MARREPPVCRKTATGRLREIGRMDELEWAGDQLLQADGMAKETLCLLETLHSSAPVGFGLIDRDFRYARVSEKLAAINGQPMAAHLGRRVAEVVPDLWPDGPRGRNTRSLHRRTSAPRGPSLGGGGHRAGTRPRHVHGFVSAPTSTASARSGSQWASASWPSPTRSRPWRPTGPTERLSASTWPWPESRPLGGSSSIPMSSTHVWTGSERDGLTWTYEAHPISTPWQSSERTSWSTSPEISSHPGHLVGDGLTGLP